MIGTDEMSSSGMDISESFRAEDLSKTDFFDFVTAAPDMGIGIGVGIDVTGVSLHSHHHQHQHQQQQHAQHQHQHPHQHLQHERLSSSNMTHDGGGNGSGGGDRDTDISVGGNDAGNSSINGPTNDSTLQSYEFWHTDKDQNRLESTIFEDLDRYCWQQQQQQQTPQPPPPPPHAASNTNSPQSPSIHRQHHHHQQQQHNHQQQQQQHPNNGSGNSSSSSSTNGTTGTGNAGSISQPSSASTVSSIDTSDGQIYTLTVLNGNETWLKRDAGGGMASSADAQLQNSLDLDSLLSNFSGYIKSEYPYDDSGFSTDGTKDGNTSTTASTGGSGGGGSGLVNGISIPSLTSTAVHHSGGNGLQSLPSLVVGGLTSGNGTNDVGTTSLSQQLAQFQNNNNDWHMADHNADQNSAESLLRSALQGKGYTKGLHVQNGITLLSSTSPTVKDDEMRRILFPSEADSLSFADSTLSGSAMFDEAQSVVGHSGTVSTHLLNGPTSCSGVGPGGGSGGTSIIVDDMFLSLESDYNDDYEKIKRLANEVQQFCSSVSGASGVVTGNDYVSTPVGSGDGGGGSGLQISPTPSLPPPQSQLHSPVGTPTGMPSNPLHLQQPSIVQKSQMRSDVIISTTPTSTTASSRHGTSVSGSGRPAKKYKRLNSASALQHHNNNNPNVVNHNSGNGNSTSAGTGGGVGGLNGANTASNATSSGGGGGGSGTGTTNTSNSPTHCNGQRKERSLHYCSICAKGFKDKYSVNVHIRTHTGEKPFACSLCGKSFRQKAHLAKHYQTHMAQKNNGNLINKASSSSAKSHRSANNNNNNSTANHNNGSSRQQQQQQQQLTVNSFSATSTANGNGIGNGNTGVNVISPPALNVLGALALSSAASNATTPAPVTTSAARSTSSVGLVANR